MEKGLFNRSSAIFVFLMTCLIAAGVLVAGPFAMCAHAADAASAPLAAIAGPQMQAGTTVTDGLQTQSKKYGLWVGGKRVTSANKNNVLGDGHVKYNPRTNTLTLKNATIKKAFVSTIKTKAGLKYWRNFGIYQGGTAKALTIKLVGKNKIVMPKKKNPVMNYGIVKDGALAITGSGSLAIKANKAQVFSVGIVAAKLVMRGKAKVKSQGRATKVTQESIMRSSVYGGYGISIEGPISMGGKAKLTAIGAKRAVYNRYDETSFSFAKGYTPMVKAGANAKSLKVNKTNPAKSVYKKYKYLSISKGKAASKKPAKVKITKVAAMGGGFSLEYNAISKNCSGYELWLKRVSTGKTYTSSTTNKEMDKLTINNLVGGDTYQVRIRAFNKVGSKTYYGAWSTTKTVVPLAGVAAG